LLRTGALPASIDTLETTTVGPSLGAASIRQGVIAAVAGMMAVLVFMLIYYRGAGINADLALFPQPRHPARLHGLHQFHAYTAGNCRRHPDHRMGVDSNVLIFERIREELRAGKTAACGAAGLWPRVDHHCGHHVTTIVSAAILPLWHRPVQGFAVTLTFGLLANLFTAVFVSRHDLRRDPCQQGRGAALSI